MVRERWYWGLIAGLLVGAVLAGLELRRPPYYSTAAQILFERPTAAMRVAGAGDVGGDVNLGADLPFVPAPEPLLAPIEGGSWILQWSSEHPQYGGSGIINPLSEEGWIIQAASATLFRAGNT